MLCRGNCWGLIINAHKLVFSVQNRAGTREQLRNVKQARHCSGPEIKQDDVARLA